MLTFFFAQIANSDPGNILPAYKWYAHPIDMGEPGVKEKSPTFVTVGPTKAGEPTDMNAIKARVKGAMLKAREKTAYGLSVLQLISKMPTSNKIPPVIGRLLRLFFGIPVSFDGKGGVTFPNTLPQGMSPVYKTPKDTFGPLKFPLYPRQMNKILLQSQLEIIAKRLQIVYNWLLGERGPIIHRQLSDPRHKGYVYGYAKNNGAESGQVWIDYSIVGPNKPEGSERIHLENAETIIHEATHALFGTVDLSAHDFEGYFSSKRIIHKALNYERTTHDLCLRSKGATPESKKRLFLCPKDDPVKDKYCDLSAAKCEDRTNALLECPVSCGFEIFKKLDPAYNDDQFYEFVLDLHLGRDDNENYLEKDDPQDKLMMNADSYARWCVVESGYAGFPSDYTADVYTPKASDTEEGKIRKMHTEIAHNSIRLLANEAKRRTPARVTAD